MSSNTPLNRLDVNFVRSCFPTFGEPLAAKTAFFENAGGSYTAGAVLERLMHFYLVNKVQPYGASEICRAAGEQMDAGRQSMADLLGVPASTVTLGPSTTQNINTLAIACAKFVGTKQEVIVTEQDHEANIGAWQRLCDRTGASLKMWPVNSANGELELNDFEALLNPSTALVCVTHSSNIVGTLNPVEEIIALCRKNGTRVVIDGVSCAPHQWPDLPALQPDAYCFSTYKTYATHLGVMYAAADFVSELDPQCHYFNLGYAGKELDTAGPDHASIAALAGLAEYFASSHLHHCGPSEIALHDKALEISSLMHRHETELCGQLLEGISDLAVRIVGRNSMDGREANIALASEKGSSAELSAALAKQDIAAGFGDFYAKRLLEKTGVYNKGDGVLRISFAHYNTTEDVQRVIDALRAFH